jgi:hypothetical protein
MLLPFTDGLVEHHDHTIDERLATLAKLVTQQTEQPARGLCHALADNCPGDGPDDIAILALRLPALLISPRGGRWPPADAGDDLAGQVPRSASIMPDVRYLVLPGCWPRRPRVGFRAGPPVP